MTKWPLFATFFILTTLISCDRKREDSKEIFKKLSWIEGEWVNEKDSTYHEIWKQTSDSTYIGKAISINGKDSLVDENLKIALNKNKIKFYNEVEEQTEESKPQEFIFTSSNPDTLIFTNTGPYYPNKITYKRINDTVVVVKVERVNESEPIRYEFTLRKKK